MSASGEKPSERRPSGIDSVEVLLLIFITLKLVGVIDWSWWWVMAPLWIPLGLVVFVGMLTAGDGR